VQDVDLTACSPEIKRLATIGKMTAFITHEVKNSLATIGGLARAVSRSLDGMPQQQERLLAIAEEVAKLEEVVQNVLTFARHPRARMKVQEVNPIVANAVEAVSLQAREGIEFRKYLGGGLPNVCVDATLMRQVFINLLRNAVEAIEEETGTVSVKTGMVNDFVEVVIADTGKGMPPEVLENLFERHYTTKEAGTGLGLAIAREIVESQEGQILACSAEGQGAEFHVLLPATSGAQRRRKPAR